MRKREGIEPRNGYETVDADVVMFTEGHIRGTNGNGPREPLGVEDRRTCIRQSRELGRSSGLLQGRG